MAKHSAGPWMWQLDIRIDHDKTYESPRLVDVAGNPILTGDIHCGSKEDALLIAAPTDLLEALKHASDLIRLMDSLCDSDFMRRRIDETREKMRSAIAKATGE